MKAYKFRLYPNKEQEEKLDLTLDICRQTYNMMLGELNEQVVIDKSQIQAMLPDMKICEPKFKEVHSKALQYECYKLFSNLSALRVLKNNKKKVGRLRFKGKGWFKTINYNQSGFKLENNKLNLSKIGNIKIKVHREVEGNIKHITIKKSIDKWFATIITDAEIKTKCGEKVLGIDLGIKNFITDSENNFVEHPHNLNRFSPMLKNAQRDLSRKKKGSNNRAKSRIRVAKIYEKITNCRDDFLHKTSTKYIKDCKIIVVEDLNIKRMMETSYNAKNIADSSWGRFIQFLSYKAESAGCEIVKINPRNTTKMCSRCSSIKKMELWDRTYKCEYCGLEIDRDYNASINILKLGLGQAYVETRPLLLAEQVLSGKQEAISLNFVEAKC